MRYSPLNDCKHDLTVLSFAWSFETALQPGIMDTTAISIGSLSHSEIDFVTKLEIGRRSVKAALFMSKMYQHADLSTIHLICRDLEDVKSMHHTTWSEEAEIELLGAQLNIYTFQLQKMSKTQQSPSQQIRRFYA